MVTQIDFVFKRLEIRIRESLGEQFTIGNKKNTRFESGCESKSKVISDHDFKSNDCESFPTTVTNQLLN